MTKQQIRVSMCNINRDLNELRAYEIAENVFAQIEQSSIFATSHTIAMYSSLCDELPTMKVIERWDQIGKQILLPRIEGDDSMEFYPYDSSQPLTQGRFGIAEPNSDCGAAYEAYKIDLMVVPGVAFSRDGGRLGRGRGYYDRYLSRGGFVAHTIGVCYPHQILDSIPCEGHDISLDEVITESCQQESSAPVTIPSIILSMLEAAGVDANRLGCGVERLNRSGLSWVLLNLTIEMNSVPAQGEKISFDTWISGCNRVVSTRDFILYNNAGDRVGVASTQWCMIDLKERKAVNLMAAEVNYIQHVQNRPSEIALVRRLPQCEEGLEYPIVESQHLASQHDIDLNNHVNTVRYIEMMLATLPSAYQQRVAPSRVSINFISESRLGDMLTIREQRQSVSNAEQYLFEIVRQDGTLSVKGLFSWSCD